MPQPRCSVDRLELNCRCGVRLLAEILRVVSGELALPRNSLELLEPSGRCRSGELMPGVLALCNWEVDEVCKWEGDGSCEADAEKCKGLCATALS